MIESRQERIELRNLRLTSEDDEAPDIFERKFICLVVVMQIATEFSLKSSENRRKEHFNLNSLLL